MWSDLFIIFYWWVLLFGLGIICLPVTFFFFKKFWDQGYALAKIISVLSVSYLVWLAGSLHWLPFFLETVLLAILLLAAFNFWLAKKNHFHFKKFGKKHWQTWLAEEVLFGSVLFFWALVRGYQPAIHGLEKYMDFGFVNSILRSHFLPPADMWLSGETINYYYFGHLVTAVLTKLSGLESMVTYNLMMATLAGLTFAASFCFSSNLIFPLSKKRFKTILAGLLTASLVTFGGNFHLLYWWLTHHGFANYWYPDATRFIVEKFGAADNTIHEFPIYSFVVADLHGHLLNLPFVLLFLNFILVFFLNKKISWPQPMALAFLMAVFYMTNTWDFAVYGLLLAVALFLFWLLKTPRLSFSVFGQTIATGLPILFFSILLSLPFHLHFNPLSQGIALVDFHSPPLMLLVLWGWPLFLTLGFVFFCWQRKKKLADLEWLVFALLLVAFLLILLPEIIYNQDIYIHSHQRANTMFKLTYQSFVIFGLTAGFIFFNALKNLRPKIWRWFFLSASFTFLFFLLAYPFFAIRSYYGLTAYQGLNGLAYLANHYPDDYQAILWLRKNIPNQPVIVEAVGESYTDFARVSANTGLPTILGWRVHEWLWRGSFDEAGQRTTIVQQIYESPDLEATKTLLHQYQVEYLFVGRLEKNQYPQLQTQKFSQLGEVVFSQGQTKIYRVNQEDR